MSAWKTIQHYLYPYRRRIALALVGMSVFTLLTMAPPLVMRYLIDEVVGKQRWSMLGLVAAMHALAPILGFTIRYFNVKIIMLAGARLVGDIRLAAFRKVMFAGMQFHHHHAAGMLICRIMDDVNMLQRLLTADTIRTLVDIIIVVCATGLLFSISVPLSLMMLVMIGLYVAAYHYFSRAIRRSTQAYRGTLDQIAARLAETLAGVRQVRIYNREGTENMRFLDRTADSLVKGLESGMASVNLSTTCAAISGFGSTLIVGLGAGMVLGEDLTFGDLAAFNTFLWMLITPISSLMNMAGQLSGTLVSIERIAEILNAPSGVTSAPDAISMPAGPRHVRFHEVDFAYDATPPLYQGLSLDVPAGSTVALVGATGCGKSTLVSLLMRMWDVQAGSISIDGTDIRHIRLPALRSIFGVVLQKPVIFEGTIAENIAYGAPHASSDDIIAAARAAEVYELAETLKDGFNTLIGPQGVSLSVGEKQRISIARAILCDPGILIMDEATSSLDSQSEALIQTALARVLAHRTCFVVAHRLSTITRADLIVVMDHGCIVETGTHQELLDRDGHYRRLYVELQGRTAVGDAT